MSNQSTESAILEATKIVQKYMSILPDHLAQMEYPIAKSCAKEEVKAIIDANPTYTVWGLEPKESSISWWNDVYKAIDKI